MTSEASKKRGPGRPVKAEEPIVVPFDETDPEPKATPEVADKTSAPEVKSKPKTTKSKADPDVVVDSTTATPSQWTYADGEEPVERIPAQWG